MLSPNNKINVEMLKIMVEAIFRIDIKELILYVASFLIEFYY